jgi:hydroxymethylbilane synthase
MNAPQRTHVIIGTRGSELARTQAQIVSEALRGRWSQLAIETKVIRTSGDERKIDVVTSRAGRKGLFTAEIERALLAEHVDLAVHSAKDLPSELSAGCSAARRHGRHSCRDSAVEFGVAAWQRHRRDRECPP